ncbi:reverse transcriptase domain-containing protein [Tanacetum coccineum]
MIEKETLQNIPQAEIEPSGVSLTKEISVNPAYPEQLVTAGGNLSKECKINLKAMLKKSIDVSAWEPSDTTGVPRQIIENSLNVNLTIKPFFQKRRVLGPNRSLVVTKEVDGSWRVCIDFKNINSACPKDYYPLPDIDGVESVVGSWYMCFLDVYKGYHEVQMAQDDGEKTTFYTDQGTYYYMKIPFELKNARATYQWLVDTAFQAQIGRNLEAYVDDMVIKSNNEKVLIADITETFDNLRKINMKLNLKKCSFGVEERKFLGYMVTSEGIRPNLKKTKAIVDMQSPRTLKEMQSLSRNLTALNSSNGGRECYSPNKKEGEAMFELGAYNMTYEPRNAIIGQVLADFLSEAPVCAQLESFFRILIEKEEKITPRPRPSSQTGRQIVKAPELLATMAFDHLIKEALVEVLLKWLIDRKEVSAIVEEEEHNWMTPIIKCLEEGVWPEDKKKARALRMKINQYVMKGGVIFKDRDAYPQNNNAERDKNEQKLHLNMDLLQERKEAASIREASMVEDQGKLGPKWDGPYRVTEAYQNGSYKLQTMEGKHVPRMWHAINLGRCY